MKRRLVFNQNVQYTDHRNNSAEEEFVHRAEKQGLLPLSRGWPDFLCFNPETKQVICVEVKSKANHRLQYYQYLMLKCLTIAGIECYYFSPDAGMVPFEIDNEEVDLQTIYDEIEQELQKTKNQAAGQ